MRQVYREFKKLCDIPTGFGWDPNTKTVTAPDDVWDDYIKVLYSISTFTKIVNIINVITMAPKGC